MTLPRMFSAAQAVDRSTVGLVRSSALPRQWLGPPLMQRLSSDTAGRPSLRPARTVVEIKRRYCHAHGLAVAGYRCRIRLEDLATDLVDPPAPASSLRTSAPRDPS